MNNFEKKNIILSNLNNINNINNIKNKEDDYNLYLNLNKIFQEIENSNKIYEILNNLNNKYLKLEFNKIMKKINYNDLFILLPYINNGLNNIPNNIIKKIIKDLNLKKSHIFSILDNHSNLYNIYHIVKYDLILKNENIQEGGLLDKFLSNNDNFNILNFLYKNNKENLKIIDKLLNCIEESYSTNIFLLENINKYIIIGLTSIGIISSILLYLKNTRYNSN